MLFIFAIIALGVGVIVYGGSYLIGSSDDLNEPYFGPWNIVSFILTLLISFWLCKMIF